MLKRPVFGSCPPMASWPTPSSTSGPRRRLRSLGAVAVVLLATVGCKEMESPGNAFQPVAVAASLPAGAAPVAEPPFPPEDYEPMVITSEELAQNAKKNRGKREAEAQAEQQVQAAPAPAGEASAGSASDEGSSPSASAPEPAPAEAGSAAAPTRETVPAHQGSAWPVRLVSSLPDTQPPRAILGLPDGREVVVTAGSMIPDQGIVVMAIGQERVQLARIAASGDHAVIKEESINAQY